VFPHSAGVALLAYRGDDSARGLARDRPMNPCILTYRALLVKSAKLGEILGFQNAFWNPSLAKNLGHTQLSVAPS
jgi:hypothetical protein